MRRIRIGDLLASEELLAELSSLLRAGGVAAIPTETFYALATDPRSGAGVERILRAKGRFEQHKPLLVLFAEPAQLDALGVTAPPGVLERFLRLWPAPLTVVVPLRTPLPASLGAPNLGIRVPSDETLRRLLARVGPVTGTSANRSGQRARVDPEEVVEVFGREIDVLVDGGFTPGGLPSTLVDATADPPRLLRAGAFAWPEEGKAAGEGSRARFPAFMGMGIVKEYAGKTPVIGNRVYLAETAAVIGDVVLGDDVSVWYNSVVRGDCNFIRIGPRSNIQDNCAIHVTVRTHPTVLEEEVTLGHGAIVHGATVRKGALIGIRATVMDGADVGESAFIGAGALVTPRTVVPPRTLWLGAPARRVRELSEAEVADLRHYHLNYLGYKEEYFRVDGAWAR
jgi:tRNA threonylcarbamoyl adenosine modification protein (Sua5/YciO/YrdC/YwlC family)